MSDVLDLRPPTECAFDVVSLGEVMLRLDPGDDRIRTTRSFRVSEGGGEYNVARALRRVFGHRAALVTALADNDVGRLLEDLLLQSGVDLQHAVWKHADDVGREHRTPLNFTERGFGVRAPVGVYDRAHSATADLQPDDVDWEHLFGDVGVRWLHTGGIFAGLSDSTLATTRTAVEAARRHGTVVSYDVNYRPSLWRAAGGPDAHRRLTDEIASGVDVLFGVDPDTIDRWTSAARPDSPNPTIVATTRRVVHSASTHDWGGVAATATGVIEGTVYDRLAVLDRVGSGDAFASGVIHALLDGRSCSTALEYGIAHGALVMTTTGDTSSATLDEVEHLVDHGAAAIRR